MTRTPLYLKTAIATLTAATAAAQVTTIAELENAINNGAPNDTVTIAPGIYELTAPLQPQPGMTITGAGAAQTIIRNAPAWNVGVVGLPDNADDHTSINRNAYLIDLADNTTDITIEHLTLTAPELHGAIYGNNADNITIRNITVDDVLWSGIRLFRVNDGLIHDNTFIDAGGRSAITSGQTGGGLFLTFTNTTDIYNNRFTKTPDHPGNFFGVKGRKATDVRIFNNTINVSFSIEFPFENDFRVEIHNNYLNGVVSIPKFAGGPEADIGESYRVYQNYFTRTYSVEGPRNGLELHDNLFDFDTNDDGGNLLATFGNNGSPVTPGATLVYNNNIKNPGRGLFWSGPIYNNVTFRNNHVITNTTITPRTEGLFGFKLNANNAGDTPDLSTLTITDNIFELNGLARPLIRNGPGVDLSPITVENNTLLNVSDTGVYTNPDTAAPRGPSAPLFFQVGVDGEFTVDGFDLYPTPPLPCAAADITADGACTPGIPDALVTLSDFSCYLSLWSNTDPIADITATGLCEPGNGGDGVDLSDFSCYLSEWSAGCP
ncbi:MAG: right-handed parallel beta-helix repeat-containing protein [Planctomycetota bacterium]